MKKTALILMLGLATSACTPAFDIQNFSNSSISTASRFQNEEQYRTFLNSINQQCRSLRQEARGIGNYNSTGLFQGRIDELRDQARQCRATYDQVVSLAASKGFSVDPVAEREAEDAAFGRALGRLVNENRVVVPSGTSSRPAACDRPGTNGHVVATSRGLC